MKLIRVDDENVTEDELEVYNIVLSTANKYGIDPSSSVESETFFVDMLTKYTGAIDNLPTWLDVQVSQRFSALKEYPKWLQNSDWPFANGEPMIFVGQLDLSPENEERATIFRSQTSLYVFIAPEVSPIVIMQQA